MNYILNISQLEGLNKILGDKNNLSILNNFGESNLSYEDNSYLTYQGIIDGDGFVLDNEGFNVLANPSSLTKIMVTGGASKYEYIISRDDTQDIQVAFFQTENYFIIESEAKNRDILDVIGDFTGRTNLKSLDIKLNLSPEEAIVLAAMIDLERRSLIRSFADELPYTISKYGVNMTWRMVHTSKRSIQWFVYCINEVLGEKSILDLDEVREALESLKDKEILLEQYGQYHLNEKYSKLANCMLINNNILTVEKTIEISKNKKISAGFTCIQSGVHDIILLDYNGSKVCFETISSKGLIDYTDKFLGLTKDDFR